MYIILDNLYTKTISKICYPKYFDQSEAECLFALPKQFGPFAYNIHDQFLFLKKKYFVFHQYWLTQNFTLANVLLFT